MLSRLMTRIPWNHPNDDYHEMEAFAATYWASYNAFDVFARAATSMRRAWDFDDYAMVPRVTGGRPGYVILKWNGGGVCKVLVAIEGMTSLSQLWAAFVGTNALGASPLLGRVFHAFKTFGDTIATEIAAHPLVTNAFSAPPVAITITGFSLGAAIAEYIGAKFSVSNAIVPVRVVKFGSPRVGSNYWRDGNTHATGNNNIYCRNDPIHNFPYSTMNQLEFPTLGFTDPFTFYANNSRITRMGEDGRSFSFVEPEGYTDYVRASLDGHAAPTPPNPWAYHSYDQYRRMMVSRSIDAGADVEQRIRYLEYFAGDWFGTNFASNFSDLSFLMASQPGNPPDFVPPTDPVVQRTLNTSRTLVQDVVVPDPLRTPRPLPAPTGNPAWRPRTTRNF